MIYFQTMFAGVHQVEQTTDIDKPKPTLLVLFKICHRHAVFDPKPNLPPTMIFQVNLDPAIVCVFNVAVLDRIARGRCRGARSRTADCEL